MLHLKQNKITVSWHFVNKEADQKNYPGCTDSWHSCITTTTVQSGGQQKLVVRMDRSLLCYFSPSFSNTFEYFYFSLLPLLSFISLKKIKKSAKKDDLNCSSSKLFCNSSDFSLKKVDWSYHKEIFTLLSGELFKVLKCLNLTNKDKLDLIKTYSPYLLYRSFARWHHSVLVVRPQSFPFCHSYLNLVISVRFK